MEEHKRVMNRMERDKKNMADVTNLDDSPCDGVLFDDSALDQKFNTYSRKHRKNLMEELANVDTE